MRANVTNQQVAKDLGISHSMVSRLRAGKRHPSVELMGRINSRLQWKFTAQMKVYGTPEYAAGFERALVRQYGEASAA